MMIRLFFKPETINAVSGGAFMYPATPKSAPPTAMIAIAVNNAGIIKSSYYVMFFVVVVL